jgi:transcription initiation factor TFIIE subunit beta
VQAAKRTHDVAFAANDTSRSDLATVLDAVNHLKEKYLKENSKPMSLKKLFRWLSLPVDQQASRKIKHSILTQPRVMVNNENPDNITICYRPLHPATDADSLRTYLATRQTAEGVLVKELKDGWPGCIPVLLRLEREGHLLIVRKGKNDNPHAVWSDSPDYHILHPNSGKPVGADEVFAEVWQETKLPSDEQDVRKELRAAGIPTMTKKKQQMVQVPPKVQKKKAGGKGGAGNGGKVTNTHLDKGLFNDYSKGH